MAAASRLSFSASRSSSGNSGKAMSTVATASPAGSPWAAFRIRSCSAKSMLPYRAEQLVEQAGLVPGQVEDGLNLRQRQVGPVLSAVFKPVGRRRVLKLEDRMRHLRPDGTDRIGHLLSRNDHAQPRR